VGHLAVQLAKRMGARVFAVASRADGVELVKRLGADAAVDGRQNDIVTAARRFAPDGLHAALFTTGGPEADQSLTAMRPGGRVAFPNGVEPEPTPPPDAPSDLIIQSYDGMPDPQIFQKLNRLIELERPDLPPFQVHIAR